LSSDNLTVECIGIHYQLFDIAERNGEEVEEEEQEQEEQVEYEEEEEE